MKPNGVEIKKLYCHHLNFGFKKPLVQLEHAKYFILSNFCLFGFWPKPKKPGFFLLMKTVQEEMDPDCTQDPTCVAALLRSTIHQSDQLVPKPVRDSTV